MRACGGAFELEGNCNPTATRGHYRLLTADYQAVQASAVLLCSFSHPSSECRCCCLLSSFLSLVSVSAA